MIPQTPSQRPPQTPPRTPSQTLAGTLAETLAGTSPQPPLPPSLEARLRRLPRPQDARRGREAAERLGLAPGPLRDLVAGAAGSSPHLADALAREAQWAAPALAAPEAALAAAMAELAAAPAPALGGALRRAKRRIGLLVALLDLGGVWSLAEVTGALTDLADLAVDRALGAAVAAELGRGHLPAPVAGEGPAAGMVALAMGKMGAGELNYSSDIDLVLLFDEARFAPGDLAAARAGFARAARAMTALLADRTPEGYAFRVDLRLRPDAATTPACLPMAAAEAYYESLGRSWERAAYIKARPCGGDLAAGERFLEALRPFVWRRHLDFAAIRDAHDMRLRIREAKGFWHFRLDGHDIKLGRGGIREIEFFAQTRQLIAGGRDPSLRVRGTVAALGRLAAAGWVPDEAAATLARHYRRLREIEHRLQMVADQQTHALPASAEGWDRLAALAGEEADELRRDLAGRIDAVHAIAEAFFAPGPKTAGARATGPRMTDPRMTGPQTTGGDGDGWGAEVTARWPRYAALRSERAVEIFDRLRPHILDRLRVAARPDEALGSFDAFLAGLPAGVQLFSLFEANPGLLDLIVDIAATAPGLARYLSRNAGVLDAVIAGRFFAPWPGTDALAAEAAAAAEGPDYEARLDNLRRWTKEWWFRIGVHHLRGLATPEEAGAQYADLAGAVLAALWPVVLAEFATRHGPPPGRGAVVLGMGSLGAGRLTAASDLDLIVIHDGGESPSAGPRPLAPRVYYARLTQALVTALSAPMAQGRLYAVDMRLRPSGRQGPVATSLPAFRDYQTAQAWTWEHLALTRARPVAGEAALALEVESFRRALIAGRAGDARLLPDMAEMRARLAALRPPDGEWDAKAGPGRLRDVELAAQALALLAGSDARGTEAQIAAGRAAGLVTAAAAAALGDAQRLFWRVQAAARLLTEGAFDPDRLGEGGRRLLLRDAGAATMADLAAAMAARAEAARRAIDEVQRAG